MKFYLVAGERSGDLHGGNLIRSLKQKAPGSQFRGFGGDDMQQAGMHLTCHYSELAFMGFTEVLANLNTIRKRISQCKADIITFNPDVLILIDYAGFNLRIAKFAREKGFKVFWYIAPKVWAWNQNRAWKLKANVDRMFVILPFEKEFFAKFEWSVDYVGNPVLDAVKNHQHDSRFVSDHKLEGKTIVALLPGSRKQELKRVIPLMTEIAARNPQLTFAVATVNNVDPEMYSQLTQLQNVTLVSGKTYDLLNHAKAAIVTSGTATLETALWNVPQVVVYRLGDIEYFIASRLIKVPFISLVNLIANKEVVRELIHTDASVENANAELTKLLEDNGYRSEMLNGYKEIYTKLDIGSASENAAEKILEYLAG